MAEDVMNLNIPAVYCIEKITPTTLVSDMIDERISFGLLTLQVILNNKTCSLKMSC